MGMMRFNFRSEILSLQVDVTITYPTESMTYYSLKEENRGEGIIPRRKWEYEKAMKFQTVYMLHGGGDDDTSIIRKSNLERYAEENCVMTVAAQVKDSFFMNTKYGYRYFTFMTEELPKVIQTLFASSDRREDNFVLGMAMGGNGALALGLKRPDLYAACVDLSGGIGCSVDLENFKKELKELDFERLRSTFGNPEELQGGEYDLSYYARKNLENNVEIPDFYIAVGEEDFIRDVVRWDRDALKKIGYNIFYEEAPGYGHDWDFWDLYIRKAFYEWLPLKRKPILKETSL